LIHFSKLTENAEFSDFDAWIALWCFASLSVAAYRTAEAMILVLCIGTVPDRMCIRIATDSGNQTHCRHGTRAPYKKNPETELYPAGRGIPAGPRFWITSFKT